MALKTRGYAHRVDIEAPRGDGLVGTDRGSPPDAVDEPGCPVQAARRRQPLRDAGTGVTRDGLVDVFDVQRRLRLIYLPPDGLPEFDGAVVDDYLLEPEGGHTIVRLLGSGIPDSIEWDGHYRKLRTAQERALARLKVMSEQLVKEAK